jgi:hypothetical protein
MTPRDVHYEDQLQASADEAERVVIDTAMELGVAVVRAPGPIAQAAIDALADAGRAGETTSCAHDDNRPAVRHVLLSNPTHLLCSACAVTAARIGVALAPTRCDGCKGHSRRFSESLMRAGNVLFHGHLCPGCLRLEQGR